MILKDCCIDDTFVYIYISAVTLSAVGDHHHHHHHRRRQMSGVSIEELQECDPQYAVEVSGGAFSWDLETKELCLKNIDLQIPNGMWFISNIY